LVQLKLLYFATLLLWLNAREPKMLLGSRAIRLLSLIVSLLLGGHEPRGLIIQTIFNGSTASWLGRFHTWNRHQVLVLLLKHGIEFVTVIAASGLDRRDNILNSSTLKII